MAEGHTGQHLVAIQKPNQRLGFCCLAIFYDVSKRLVHIEYLAAEIFHIVALLQKAEPLLELLLTLIAKHRLVN